MQIERIAPSLYRFTLTLNEFQVNLGVFIGEDGVLLIDTSWMMTADAVLEKIGELTAEKITKIIFTHKHGDHIGGRSVLGKYASYLGHKNIQDDLEGRYYSLEPLPGMQRPAEYLASRQILHFNDARIDVFPAPGHTDGDLVVYFPDVKIAFIADLLFSDSFPAVFFGDGGHPDQLIATLDSLLVTLPEDTLLIAGHGRDYNLTELKDYRDMIAATTELIRGQLNEGKDADDIYGEGLLDEWEKWSTPAISTEAWIGFVCDCLNGLTMPSIAEPLSKTVIEKGAGAAINQYHDLKENQTDYYNFGENELNLLGYNLLWRERIADAIAILTLQAEIFPDSANSYDSLGEVYEASGQLDRAETNFRTALEIDPEFAPSKDGLERVLNQSNNLELNG